MLTSLFVLLLTITLVICQRILGGTEIDILKCPWQVSIETKMQQFCGRSFLKFNYLFVKSIYCVKVEVYSTRIG